MVVSGSAENARDLICVRLRSKQTIKRSMEKRECKLPFLIEKGNFRRYNNVYKSYKEGGKVDEKVWNRNIEVLIDTHKITSANVKDYIFNFKEDNGIIK